MFKIEIPIQPPFTRSTKACIVFWQLQVDCGGDVIIVLCSNPRLSWFNFFVCAL